MNRIYYFWLLLFSLEFDSSSGMEDNIWQKIQPPAIIQNSRWLFTDFLEDSKIFYYPIWQVAFAADGTAWFATSNGLFRYNGYQWAQFTEKDGLPSSLVRCVLVTKKGILWVGTDKGAGIFDGHRFNSLGTEKRLVGQSIRRIIEDFDGSLWFCCDPWPDTSISGGVSFFYSGRWSSITMKDGLTSKFIRNYFRDTQNRQFILTDNGLFRIDKEGVTDFLKETGLTEPITAWDASPTPDGGIIISTASCLFSYQSNKWKRFPVKEEYAYRLLLTKDRQLLICKQDGSFWGWKNEQLIQLADPNKNFSKNAAEYITEDPFGSIWSTGYNNIFRWERSPKKWVRYEDLKDPLFVDHQGRVWFNAQKPIVKDNNEWYQINASNEYYFQDSNKDVWSRSNQSLFHWQETARNPVRYDLSQIRLDSIRGIIPDAQGSIWVYGDNDKDQSRLYNYSTDQWNDVTPQNYSDYRIIEVTTSPSGGIWCVAESRQSKDIKIVHLTKDRLDPIPSDPIISAYISSGKQFKLIVTAEDNLWIYGDGILCVYRGLNIKQQQWDHIAGLVDRSILSVIRRDEEEWFLVSSSKSNIGGIAKFNKKNRSWSQLFFDIGNFCSAIADGTIYCSGNNCIFLIPPKWDQKPLNLPIPYPGAVTQLIQEGNGELWVGVNNSVLNYHPGRIPPKTIVKNRIQYVFGGYPLHIECEGRSFFVPQSAVIPYRISWQIDNSGWTPFDSIPSEGIQFGGLPLGSHTIRFRTQDEDSNIESPPTELHFDVYPVALFDMPWFKVIFTVIFFIISFLAVYAFKARRKAALYAGNLEFLVDQRTDDLRKSKTKYRDLVQNANNIILRMTPQGIILFFNEYAQAFFEFSEKEILGQNILNTIIPVQESTGRNLHEPFLKFCNSPDRYPCLEMECVSNNGRRVWIAWTAKTIQNEDSNSSEILCIGTDVTEKKQLEKQLLQSHKMEAVGQLAGGVAHNINNLLMGIIGYLSLEIKSIPDKHRNGIQCAIDAANRSAELVKGLLAFSRKSSLSFNLVDLNEVVFEVYQLLKETINRRITIVLQTGENLPPIMADKAQIHSVVMNLCINGRDAIEKVLQDDSAKQRHQDTFEIILQTETVVIHPGSGGFPAHLAEGQYVALKISDNGCGIEEETQHRIFEPFYTTKPIVGTGLGLASAFGITKQHNGWIDFTSQYGKGTQFKLFFPACTETLIASPQPQTDETPRGGTETILFADDEELILNLAQIILEEGGYTVLLASDGKECVDLFRQHREQIDLIILDISMPKLSGPEVLSVIQKEAPEKKVMISSGHGDDLDTNTLKQAGAWDFFSKPYKPEDLLQKVRVILDM